MKKLMLFGLLIAGCGKAGDPPPPPPPDASVKPQQKSDTQTSEVKELSPEAVAKLLLEDAGRDKSGKPEAVQAAYHAVAVRCPQTSSGRRAIERCIELEAEVVKALDREFAAALTPAEELRKAGRFADSIASLRSFRASTSKESLQDRANRQIERVENDANRAYVDAVRAARQAVSSGSLDEAARLLKSAAEKSTPDVREASERDLDLLSRYRAAEEERKLAATESGARKAFGDRAANLLKRIRERAYGDVLKELDTAIADPALAPVKDRLTADRAAVAAAQSFWEAAQKTLKAHLNQEVQLKTADGKSVRGVLKKLGDPLKLDAVDHPLASLHSDQFLVLAINSEGLAEESGQSYAAAAMWFFLEGRAAEARLELATAGELGADIASLEAAWRRGFFRFAIGK